MATSINDMLTSGDRAVAAFAATERAIHQRESAPVKQLIIAAQKGDMEMLRTAKDRGATNYIDALKAAHLAGHVHHPVMLKLELWNNLRGCNSPYRYFNMGIGHDMFGVRSRWATPDKRPARRTDSRSPAGDHQYWIYVWRELWHGMTPEQKSKLNREWARHVYGRDAHERMLDIAIALGPLDLSGHLCVYVASWIIEWAQGQTVLLELARVRLLESVRLGRNRLLKSAPSRRALTPRAEATEYPT
jgi:hypothetical protein